MQFTTNKIRFWFLTAIILVLALTRLLPYLLNMPELFNFSPIAAMALFGGAYLMGSRKALIVPLICLFASDFILQIGYWAGWLAYPGFHATMPAVYACLALMVGLGVWLKNGRIKPFNVIGATLVGSTLFFIITNLAVWFAYSDGRTLMQCYAEAMPFFRNTLIGNLLFVSILFGGFEWLQRTYPKLQVKRVAAA